MIFKVLIIICISMILSSCYSHTVSLYNKSLLRSDICIIKTDHDYLKIIEVNNRPVVDYVSDHTSKYWPSIIQLESGEHSIKAKYSGFLPSSLVFSCAKGKSYILRHEYQGYNLVLKIDETEHIPMKPPSETIEPESF